MHIKTKNITTQSVASPRTPHLSMIPIVTFTFELWPPKSIGFTNVNMSAKFDKEAHNGLVCIGFTAFFHTCPLWPWPLTFDLHPLTMVNMSAKFDKEIHNDLISIVFISLFPYYVHCDLDLWPLTSKINRVHPLAMANICTKFDQEAHNGLVAIVFTSYFHICPLWPSPLISDLQNQ